MVGHTGGRPVPTDTEDVAMNRKLDISARQVTALCKGAEKAGFIVE